MSAFQWAITGFLFALVVWIVMTIPYRPTYKEHEHETDAGRAEADEQIESIRDALRPSVDGKVLTRSTDFGELK
jgi:hypothetical protein